MTGSVGSQKPVPGSEHIRDRMRRQRRSDTTPELVLRRALFAMGLRYRVGLKVPGAARRTIDIAFPKQKLAVFVDGCFWHACPLHSVPVKNNANWWDAKLKENVNRDRNTDLLLQEAGWSVLRFWEHEDPERAATRVGDVLNQGKR